MKFTLTACLLAVFCACAGAVEKPMPRITHVGYSMDSALVDFSKVEITSE